jgi:hypothetical protein
VLAAHVKTLATPRIPASSHEYEAPNRHDNPSSTRQSHNEPQTQQSSVHTDTQQQQQHSCTYPAACLASTASAAAARAAAVAAVAAASCRCRLASQMTFRPAASSLSITDSVCASGGGCIFSSGYLQQPAAAAGQHAELTAKSRHCILNKVWPIARLHGFVCSNEGAANRHPALSCHASRKRCLCIKHGCWQADREESSCSKPRT